MAQWPRNHQASAKSASSAGRSLGITLVGIAALMAIVVSVTVVFWPERPVSDVRLGARDRVGSDVATRLAALPPPGLRAGRHLNTAANVAYVGTQRCVACHEHQHRSYLDTPHSQALGKMGDGAEPANGSFVHAASTLAYAVRQEGDDFRHRISLRDADGSPLVEREFSIAYHIGSGNHSRSYLLSEGPFLFESPLTWYRSRDGWGLSPGYDRALPGGFERMVDYGCLVCHAGRVETRHGNRFQATIVEGTIGCESCHGPGQLHVDHWQDRPRPAAPAEEDLTIVNPARLTRDESEQICSFCHLRGVSGVAVRGRRLSDFRPGLPLSDFRIDYFTEARGDDMKVTGHVEQMRRSKCYKSSDTMTCLTCHDPHARPAPSDRTRHFRAKCVNCHDEHCGLDLATRTSRQADDDCVACHMPRGDTDIAHIAFTHHRVGIPPTTTPKDSTGSVAAPARLVASDSLEHLDDADQLRGLGLAYAEYSEKQATSAASESCRDTARRFLRQAYERGIRDAASLATLAGLELEHGRRDEAMRLAREAVEYPNLESGGHENARFVLTNAYLESDDLANAQLEMLQVVEQRYRPEDWLLLAEIQQRRGDLPAAIVSLHSAEKLNPFRPDVQQRLALAYGRAGDQVKSNLHRRIERRLRARLAESRGAARGP